MSPGHQLMKSNLMNAIFSRFGMVLVLLGLVVIMTILTWGEQTSSPRAGAESVARQIQKLPLKSANVVIVIRDLDEDRLFSRTLSEVLLRSGISMTGEVMGDARAARLYLSELAGQGQPVGVIAVPEPVSRWVLFEDLKALSPAFAATLLLQPRPTQGSVFLSPANLRNVFSQISIVAIMAIGMTMVIISGGIDLSVGSLAALASVFSCLLIDQFGGAMNAGASALVCCSLAGIALCGVIGLLNGYLVTSHRIPPFIMTLAMMLIARGGASILSQGKTIIVNPSYNWLGTGATLGVPNIVVLMALLYSVAWVIMNRMRFGRHLYAVGGNREAAHLSGVPIHRILIAAYFTSGLLAGLGGIILASQFNSGSHVFGMMYELKVIAAVVVGGTSLNGGHGHVLGTFVGALIIGIIGNGMNLLGLDSFVQEVVLGAVILSAVWIDNHKK